MKVELVTNLKRHATRILADLHESKEAVLITEHGQPSAYLVDVDDYQFMQKRLALLEALSRGERAVAEGNVVNHEQAKDRLSKWLK
ncbi:type II toxin-antitoxin system Phd/YefM family antitoxin [Pseudomonas sp. SH1-B]